MTDEIILEVEGVPVPQGSMRAFIRGGRAVTFAGNAGRLERWRGDIRSAARDAMAGRAPLTGPVEVSLRFRMTRPASHFLPANSRRLTSWLRVDAPVFHAGTPDLDKLERAVLDALTGIAYVDDAQVAMLRAEKRYAHDGLGPGVEIELGYLVVTP